MGKYSYKHVSWCEIVDSMGNYVKGDFLPGHEWGAEPTVFTKNRSESGLFCSPANAQLYIVEKNLTARMLSIIPGRWN